MKLILVLAVVLLGFAAESLGRSVPLLLPPKSDGGSEVVGGQTGVNKNKGNGRKKFANLKKPSGRNPRRRGGPRQAKKGKRPFKKRGPNKKGKPGRKPVNNRQILNHLTKIERFFGIKKRGKGKPKTFLQIIRGFAKKFTKGKKDGGCVSELMAKAQENMNKCGKFICNDKPKVHKTGNPPEQMVEVPPKEPPVGPEPAPGPGAPPVPPAP